MDKIPEETREAIISMRKEGVSFDKISKHTKDFGRTIAISTISLICKGVKKGAPAGSGKPGSLVDAEFTAEDPREIAKEIKNSIDELNALHITTLKMIRQQLIEACAKLHAKE